MCVCVCVCVCVYEEEKMPLKSKIGGLFIHSFMYLQ